MEVGCRGFISKTAVQLLHGLKSVESGEGAGRRGREGELLALEEGERLGANTPVKAAAGVGGEMSPIRHFPAAGRCTGAGAKHR